MPSDLRHLSPYPPGRRRPIRRWVNGRALTLLSLVAGLAWLQTVEAGDGGRGAAMTDPEASVPDRLARAPLTDDEVLRVGDFAAKVFRGEPVPASERIGGAFDRTPAVVFVAARARGERLAFGWRHDREGTRALRAAVEAVADVLETEARLRVTTLEINLGHGFRPIALGSKPEEFTNLDRGRRGVEVIAGRAAYRLAPTEMIAMNVDFAGALERLARQASLPRDALGTPAAPVRRFEADQLLVGLLGPGITTTRLYRGNTLVPIEAVNQASVQRLAEAQSAWMLANLQADGRMVYLYWPSRGEESTANNAVRQWMASIALGRIARLRNDPAVTRRTEQNLQYNLAHFYREDPDGHGLIVEADGDIKLGAIALAALALVESPVRAHYSRPEAALCQTVRALWHDTGEFATYWHPRDRTDNVNFYPGEALLLWATLYAETRDPDLLERILTSLRYYRSWHRAQRNPAFVPWHTQAYRKVWSIAPSDEIRDWVFEMNHWLLGIQQWETQREFPDTMGRFYDPDHPFGPPHSSSNGVYLEGLVDAWELARSAGDTQRQADYRRAIVRGLRCVLQDTFLDDAELFYISQHARAWGGVRTTPYDNAIRVDNVQHSLLAVLKVLAAFSPEDYQP